MSLKNFSKDSQRWAARVGFFSFSWLISRLPYSAVRGMSAILVAIGFCFTGRQQRIAKESLTIAFGKTKSLFEINQIIKDCFKNLGYGMIEMLYFLAHPQKVSTKVSFVGKEHLDQALAEGKGVIAVTAHFGNFPLMMLFCAQAGYKINSIIRPARDEKLERYLFKKRQDCKVNTVYAVPRRECVTNSLKALRNNEILFIPLDQNFGSQGGVFVDFFGQKAATATGPVVFAERTKAPIVPMFIIRNSKDTHQVIVEKPIILEEGKNEEETIAINIAKITKLIEEYIRRYPYEWGWMHRRWKSRPTGNEGAIS